LLVNQDRVAGQRFFHLRRLDPVRAKFFGSSENFVG